MYTMDQIHHIRQLYYEQGLSVTVQSSSPRPTGGGDTRI